MKSNGQEELDGAGSVGQGQPQQPSSAASTGARQDSAPPDQRSERVGSPGSQGEQPLASRDGGGEANPSGGPLAISTSPSAAGAVVQKAGDAGGEDEEGELDEDKPEQPLDQSDFLRNAPDRDGEFVRVRPVLE